MTARFLIAALGAATAATASGQVASQTFNLGDLLVSGETITPLDLTGVSGDFVAFRVTTDWSVAAGDPWSTESSVFFGDPGTFTIISDVAGGQQAENDGDPVPGLRFLGGFDVNPAGLSAVDFVANSGGFGDANFDNTVIEWFQESDLSPAPTFQPGPASPNAPTSNVMDLGVIGGPGSNPVIDTFGSDPTDTELALYAEDGTLLDSNDDAGGTLQSEVSGGGGGGVSFGSDGTVFFGGGGLGPGVYYVALSEFDADFGEDFSVLGGVEVGDILPFVLNIDGEEVASGDLTSDGDPKWFSFTIVPTPGALAIFGMAGLAGLRRRR